MSTSAELKATKPVKWWHEAIIDDMLAFPTHTLEERGKRLGYSASYLCIIINTDMFQAAYAKRRDDFRSTMDHALTTRATEVAVQGMDLMLKIMEEKRTQIPFAALTDTVDKTLTRLGYGVQKQGQPAAVNVNVQGNNVAVLPTVTAEQLTTARDMLRAVEQARGEQTPSPHLKLVNPAPEPGES